MPAPTSTTPPQIPLSEDTIDDLLYLARTNDLPDLSTLASTLATIHSTTSAHILAAAIDSESGNTCLHYACANGCEGVVGFLVGVETGKGKVGGGIEADGVEGGNGIESVNADGRDARLRLLHHTNSAGNTALHYASMNGQLGSVKLLLQGLEACAESDTRGEDVRAVQKRKMDFLSQKNAAGYDAAFEAERAGKDEVVGLLLGLMDSVDEEHTKEDAGAPADVGAAEEGEEEVIMSAGVVNSAKENLGASNGVERRLDDLRLDEEKG